MIMKEATLAKAKQDLATAESDLNKAKAAAADPQAKYEAAKAALPELQARADAAQAALAAKAARVAALKRVEAQATAMKHQAHQAALPQTGEATPAVGWMSALGLAMVSMLTGTSLLKKRHN